MAAHMKRQAGAGPLRIVRPYEISLEAAKRSLEQTVGLILRTERNLWVFLKAAKTSSLDFRPSESTSVHFFAVAGSVTEGRNIEAGVSSFVAAIKNLFSVREVNMRILTDFLSEYISEKIFGKDSERPLPLEMAVIEINRKKESAILGITTIDHTGNAAYPDDNFSQIIFGCTDPDKEARIRAALTEGLRADCNDDEVEAVVKRILADFPGDMLMWAVDFERPTGFVGS